MIRPMLATEPLWHKESNKITVYIHECLFKWFIKRASIVLHRLLGRTHLQVVKKKRDFKENYQATKTYGGSGVTASLILES